jgi:hypothetical protein
MQRRIDGNGLRRVWVERVAWNVAAIAMLSAMVAILLCSLRWLDEIDPDGRRDRAAVEVNREPEVRPARIARADRARG